MTSNIRKALFKSLMAQSIENENVVIIGNGEEVYTYLMWACIPSVSPRIKKKSEGGIEHLDAVYALAHTHC